MKTWRMALGLGLLAIAGGCKPAAKAKEITSAARAEAVQLFNEAEFATQVREHPRAEGLLARAVELDPEEPNYWLQRGAARKRLGNLAGARKDYEQGLALVQAAYQRDTKSPGPLFAEIEICILLGKPDEARGIYQKALQDHRDDPEMQKFARNHVLDALLSAPGLKEMSL